MGVAASMYNANWPPKANWSVDDMPDLSNKVIIVTGGNSGIGRETVKALLNKNAKVYIAAHSQVRSEQCIQDLKAETGHQAHFLELNLASLGSVKASAQQFQQLESKLDALINNAGVMIPGSTLFTKEGFDLQFGVNTIGHFYFTQLLLPQLGAAGSSRVVNVSSHGHVVGQIDYDTIKDGPARDKMAPLDLYNQSKFAMVAMNSEFARRHDDKGIVFISCHPGLIVTNLGRSMSPLVVRAAGLLSYDSAKGALTQLYGATAPEASTANGKYLIPWARVGNPHPATLDPEVGAQLWSYLEEQTKNV
ncbi:NAD(P)-binding protein [Collybia nuda]|uniref:NAD(P)-binding protein n=1 Tax=Collybia nuda TaxID=64659 RepID=A0A9P6CKY5_9AGAR|nr:NAD(P)-binding protein [Collybia nuda]